MKPRVLFIDDDPVILAEMTRVVRRGFAVESALSAEEGLGILAEQGPFAVIVSDIPAPGSTGAEIFIQSKSVAPDAVRILMTHDARMETIVEAVNLGSIFRILDKPCSPAILLAALNDAAAEHFRVAAERELRDRTLDGAMTILTEMMAMVHPGAMSHVSRVRDLVCQLGEKLELNDAWELPIVASLSLLGTVALPDSVLARALAGDRLTERERSLLESHPRVAYQMLQGIPQLAGVAEAILHQSRNYDGSSGFAGYRRGTEIPIASRILKVASDFEAHLARGCRRQQAINEMNKRHGVYDPEILDLLAEVVDEVPTAITAAVAVNDLHGGMMLAAPVVCVDGNTLLKEGLLLNDALVERIRAVAESVGVIEPINVVLPSDMLAEPVRSSSVTDIFHHQLTNHGEPVAGHTEIQPREASETDPALQRAFPELFGTT